MAIALYIFVLPIFLFSFAFQRTTRNISQLAEMRDIQAAISPPWIIYVGVASQIALLISLILLWFQNGILYAIGAGILSTVITTFMPIPHNTFLNMIEKYIEKKKKDPKDFMKHMAYS